MIAALGVLAVAGVFVLCLNLPREDTPAPSVETETTAPSAAPTVVPEATAKPTEMRMLPILAGANTAQKKIAITIDDLNQTANLGKILDLCEQYGAKVTLFALGSNVKKDVEMLRRAHEMGMEIENHTYDHEFVYKLEDDDLIWEIQQTAKAINQALGVNYQMHFLRPPGGNGRDDPRLHALLIQAGYSAVAHWNLSGTSGVSNVLKKVQPGNVILYHTTDDDVKRLSTVIPQFVQMGYQMVTLNELFGYPENEISAYDESAAQIAPPITQPYSYDDITFANGTRMYGVKLFQNRLIELGYLAAGNADGDYGDVTAAAVKLFQAEAGLPVTGKADPQTRETAGREDAPRNRSAALSVK